MKERIHSLVQSAQRGDAEAFGKLVETFQDAVFGAAYTIVRSFHDAQDIAQEAFILAYEELPRLREPEKFPGWLRRITTTACSRFLRSRKAVHQDLSTVMDTPTGLPGPDAVAEAHEVKDMVLGEIHALSEKNRLVTTLYFINGYSYNEISDFLEVPTSTVKSRLHESRKILQGRLMEMAKDVLHANKPGAEFVEQLRKQLNGRIVELPDGRMQVFYDFVDEGQLQDWRTFQPYDAAPEVKKDGMAFGRIEPEETPKQWDRDIRLNLVLDPDPESSLGIDYNVIMGTTEPWTSTAWVLTRRDGYGPGIPFFYASLTDWSEEWRRERNQWTKNAKDGHVMAHLAKRCDFQGQDRPGYCRFAVPGEHVPIAESYHMKVTRDKWLLRWEINGQAIGETGLADDEQCLTERLVFCNYGKGTGAVFRNVVIRSRVLGVDPSWPEADGKEAQSS